MGHYSGRLHDCSASVAHLWACPEPRVNIWDGLIPVRADNATDLPGDQPAANGDAATPDADGIELSGFGALGTWRKCVRRTPLTAEEALKHLLLSVDVDKLYRCHPLLEKDGPKQRTSLIPANLCLEPCCS